MILKKEEKKRKVDRTFVCDKIEFMLQGGQLLLTQKTKTKKNNDC